MTRDHQTVVDGVLAGAPRAIARAISLVEAEGEAAAEVIKGVFHRSARAYLLGVTGSPGVGKSSLVDQLVRAARREERTVAVLAVDPTSPFSGGALLGDRVRMQAHTGDAGVFVRSMATRGELGGLARATGDALVVLDAAGFDLIIIETVGVGQADVEISRRADMTIVVTMPGAGDGVQALKAGVMEIADLFVVNKADHDGADRTVAEIETMLGLSSYGPQVWRPPILTTVATEGTGVAEVMRTVDAFRAHGSADFGRRRRLRLETRVRQLVSQRLLRHVEQHGLAPRAFAGILDRVVATDLDPYTAAEHIVSGALGPQAQRSDIG
ncbi:MAG: methylmalonyl Co-A mutase-associated GTPase MeaB [Acidobacteria bacterium]|nr:methylmalonyl Co-A mutase-associated GTPase MeaB [Acidobacteriota bacterium]